MLWPFTTMKPSLMLGTSTGQELLFVRIMSKSHTSAWKTNVHTHRLVSTSIGLTQLRILHLYLTYQPNGNYVTQTFLSPPDLAISCFPGTQLYIILLVKVIVAAHQPLPWLLAKPE